MKWDNLTMSQKQALMKIYVNNGVTNLDEIRNHYNRFDDGGYTNMPQYVTENREQAILQTAPTRVQRFKNRVNMIGEALGNFLPSSEEAISNAATDRILGNYGNKFGILEKINNLPNTVSNIKNLKKALNLPYNQGLIDSGKGNTIVGTKIFQKNM